MILAARTYTGTEVLAAISLVTTIVATVLVAVPATLMSFIEDKDEKVTMALASFILISILLFIVSLTTTIVAGAL